MICGKYKESSKPTYKTALWDICYAYSPRTYVSMISIKAFIIGNILFSNAFMYHMKGLFSLNYIWELGDCVNVSVRLLKNIT